MYHSSSYEKDVDLGKTSCQTKRNCLAVTSREFSAKMPMQGTSTHVVKVKFAMASWQWPASINKMQFAMFWNL